MKITAEDVKYLARHNVSIRHVADQDQLHRHVIKPTLGDAHCISAIHLLLTPEERAESGIASKYYVTDENLLPVIDKYAGKIAERLDQKLSEIASSAKLFLQENSHFLIVRDMMSAKSPYDLDAYPMGKAGRQEINPSQISNIIKTPPGTPPAEIKNLLGNALTSLHDTAKVVEILGFAADEFIKGRVQPQHLQQDIQRFGQNLNILRRADPHSAFSFSQSLLSHSGAAALHDVAEFNLKQSLHDLKTTQPALAKSLVSIIQEREAHYHGTPHVNARLLNAVTPAKSPVNTNNAVKQVSLKR